VYVAVDEDIDGTPMEEGSKPRGGGAGPGFVLSRWETVDPETVEAQAMTTSKWDTLEQQTGANDSQEDEDASNVETRYHSCGPIHSLLKQENNYTYFHSCKLNNVLRKF
jgi:U2-associated protein SR140